MRAGDGYRCGDILCYAGDMLIAREPNYLYLTIGLLAAVVLATSAGEQISFATAGVLVAAITFIVTAWFVIESKRQFVLVGALALTALLPFLRLVSQPEEQFPGLCLPRRPRQACVWPRSAASPAKLPSRIPQRLFL